MSVEIYKNKFPNAPLQSEESIKKATKNAGQHMKTDKYKKMFSELLKGENNPNHHSKTTKEHRKSLSPFSKEFYRKKYPNASEEELLKMTSDFAKEAIKDRVDTTQLEYYTNQGMNIEEATIARKERQSTFSLEKCIEKYGEELGKKRWLDRQEKWHKNYKKTNFSKISQILFQKIYEEIKNENLEIYFATLTDNKKLQDLNDKSFKDRNFEYSLRLNNITIKPDFFIKSKNKIIEFDGVYYHRNNPENVARTILRDKEIIESGYKVLHINEIRYLENKNLTIKECVDWILK